MDKRHQVFVSSTYTDLVEERAEVISTLLNLDALPAGMELFPATNDDAWTLIQRVINESDYYLLVVGGRYGSVDDTTNLSYTENEFDYAVSVGKPVLAFLHGHPGKIPVEKTDQNDGARQKLDAFREKVERTVHVKYWKGQNDLGGLVATSFVKIQRSHPAVGWVRGDVQTSSESLEELNDLRKRLEVAERRLDAARKGPPPGTEEFSQGTEKVQLPVTVHFNVIDHLSRRHGHTVRVDATTDWDGVFSAVAPSLIDEADQGTMRSKLDAWFVSLIYEEAETEKDAWLAEATFRVSSDAYQGGGIGEADFDTILLQLRALGLIAMSDRRRSLRDTETYWTLTPYGDEQMVALRAIRRGQPAAAARGKSDGAQAQAPG